MRKEIVKLAAVAIASAIMVGGASPVLQMTVSAETNQVIPDGSVKVEIPEKYIYEFTAEEQGVVNQAVAETDGEEAARLVNSITGEFAFEKAVKTVLNTYYADDDTISENLIPFSENLDERGKTILGDYEEALAERRNEDNLSYTPGKIKVTFSAGVSDEDINQLVQKISSKVYLLLTRIAIDESLPQNVKDRLEKVNNNRTEKEAFIYLAKDQTVAKVVDIYSHLNGVIEAISIYELDDASGEMCEEEQMTLNQTKLTLYTSQQSKLKAKIEGKSASDILWSSSDEKVATVSKGGKVTAVSKGTAVITAVSKKNKDVTAQCTVIVKNPSTKISSKSYLLKSEHFWQYDNRIITSYAQMKKIVKSYSKGNSYDKKVLKKLKSYDESYFKKKSLCLFTFMESNGTKVSVVNVKKRLKSSGKFEVNAQLNAKYPFDSPDGYTANMVNYIGLIEISKGVSDISNSVKVTIDE